MPILKKRHIPFGEQSRHYRKNAYIEIKNLIRRDAPVLGGLFTTHDYMHGKNGWIDGFFQKHDTLTLNQSSTAQEAKDQGFSR
ncbi:MAG: hypothetical protein KBF98_13790 [Rhodoferax sp.]|jgi:hypothetical protein|nr:hypothetical protein [Rhodoferax sp.]MBP9061373.1 hypothetical protein [Rhodoferax sp.]MBP9685945.1 hypothetical protein [Rhodoferax sp.]